MTNLVEWVRRRGVERNNPGGPWAPVTLDQFIQQFGQFGYQGLGYGPGLIQTYTQNHETIQGDFAGFIGGAYKANGAIFACMLVRMLLFSEARFQFRRKVNGRPGALFGTNALQPLENPWAGGTTGDLLRRAITDADLAGNFYCTPVADPKVGRRLARLRPDWVTIVLGSVDQPDVSAFDPTAELLGYIYQPGGSGSGLKPKIYLPEEVAHFAPIPDPQAHFRGMSWIQPIINELLGDQAMITHKQMFFEQGATPNLVVSMETGKMNRETFKDWIDLFENEHSGAWNAWKTLYLANGANATVVGSSLKDLDYGAVQGQTEARIAAAAGVPPIVAGFVPGLESGTYSNYGQAMRRLSDGTLRPLWRDFAASMATIVNVPGGSELWYDDRDIPFLQDDEKDEAEVQLTKATAMRLLVDAGYTPDSIVSAIESNDYTLLQHSGLYSVQLRPPGSNEPDSNSGDGSGDSEDTNDGDGDEPGQNSNSGESGTLPAGTNGTKSKGRLAAADPRAILPPVDNVEKLAQALLTAKAGD